MRKTTSAKKAITIRVSEKEYTYVEQLCANVPYTDTVSGMAYTAFITGLYVLLANHAELTKSLEGRYTEQLTQLIAPALRYLEVTPQSVQEVTYPKVQEIPTPVKTQEGATPSVDPGVYDLMARGGTFKA